MSAVMTGLQRPRASSEASGHDALAIDLIRQYVARQMLSLEAEDRWWQSFAAFYADAVLTVPALQEIAVEVATDQILASHGCEPWSVARRRWQRAG